MKHLIKILCLFSLLAISFSSFGASGTREAWIPKPDNADFRTVHPDDFVQADPSQEELDQIKNEETERNIKRISNFIKDYLELKEELDELNEGPQSEETQKKHTALLVETEALLFMEGTLMLPLSEENIKECKNYITQKIRTYQTVQDIITADLKRKHREYKQAGDKNTTDFYKELIATSPYQKEIKIYYEKLEALNQYEELKP